MRDPLNVGCVEGLSRALVQVGPKLARFASLSLAHRTPRAVRRRKRFTALSQLGGGRLFEEGYERVQIDNAHIQLFQPPLPWRDLGSLLP